MSLSVYPSPCKVTICAFRTSVKEDCFAHSINVEMTERKNPQNKQTKKQQKQNNNDDTDSSRQMTSKFGLGLLFNDPN